MQVASYSEVRKNFKSYLDKARDDSVPIFIKRQSDEFVIIRKDIFDSMNETDYLLSNPANAKHLKKSLEEIKKGNYLEFDSIEDLDNALKD